MRDEIHVSEPELIRLIRHYNYASASVMLHLQKLNAQLDETPITNDDDYDGTVIGPCSDTT